MAKFTDCLGREWRIALTLADLPRLREAGLSISRAVKDGGTLDVLEDPESTGRVLWCLCEGQAASRGVDPDGFARGFDGPTLAAAVDAVVEALVAFSQRPAIAAELIATRPVRMRAIEERAIETIRTRGWNGPAGSSPASPASTPAG